MLSDILDEHSFIAEAKGKRIIEHSISHHGTSGFFSFIMPLLSPSFQETPFRILAAAAWCLQVMAPVFERYPLPHAYV